MDLWENCDTGKLGKEVYVLPNELDEKVARLHLAPIALSPYAP
jgi:S-adenosylhomocysteine hydrolase